MPDVSPSQLVAARRGYRRVYGVDPDAVEGICGLCDRKVNEKKEKYVISVNGVWAHWDCINEGTKEEST